ncbi:Gfo/Idh/MocA family oxidoreductase [Salinisphaera sp.]|uniref:Gfo/Idh/MocA family protein n=1 Tax=Salinisphaera sp. TaxID=1914330 RepID=UPI002D79ECFA|nr:Gfo/Idh/MocA family oxidoreductase [Salinisphaera sp.]HET7313858.1 Gfo/Idh/MocA family oxidoreductase [Salinisphaera sp.]
MRAFEHPIRIGMVGGGPGAGIATAHRAGLRLDGRYDLVAGVFSRDLDKSRQAAREFGVDESRVYADYADMAAAEAAREDGIEAVAVVTPNASHYPVSKVFLEHGIHVICDKPMTDDFDKALELHWLAESKHLVFTLTHNYACHSMVREAARRVRCGDLGELRMVQGEFASGWAAGEVETEADNKQAAWRTDPEQAGEASVIYDLGTHIHHLARYVSGLPIAALAADLSTVVPHRRVYDNANVMLRFAGGARGALWITMAATGSEHGLRIRVVGSKASLEWRHEDPHHLQMRYPDGRREELSQGGATLSADAAELTRIGLGHPEGFLESFANIYSEAAAAIAATRAGKRPTRDELAYPSTADGVLGLQFVDAVRESAGEDGRWVRLAPIDGIR